LRAPDSAPTRRDASAKETPSALPCLVFVPVATTDTRAETLDLANALTADFGTYFSGINWLDTAVRTSPSPGGYVLNATLRTQGARLRLETRLLDPNGAPVWTHKSDSTLADSFDWQDSVVEDIAGHGTDMILEAETLRLTTVPDDDMTPEQCLLMGIMAWRTFSNDSFVRAASFQARAIAAKPDMADAYAEAIIVVCAGRTMGTNLRMKAYQQKLPEWVEAARPLAIGHAVLTLAIGIATYLQDQRMPPLNQTVSQVLRMVPFDARVLSFCGWANLWSGQTQAALDCFDKSINLGKLGPFLVASYGGAATACVQLGLDNQALDYCAAGLALADTYPTLYSAKCAAQALTGDLEGAEVTLKRYRELLPDRTLAEWRLSNSYGESDGGKRYFEGMRLAGLPEE
jgi:adenylate cyclase